MICDRSLRVYDGVFHIIQFFMGCIRSCSGTTTVRHRAYKRHSRENTYETSNDCRKLLHPGTVITRILVLLLMLAACAEVRSYPSSLDGSQTGGLKMSLQSTEASVKVNWIMQDPNVRCFMVVLQVDTFITDITYIDTESASKTDFVDLTPCTDYTVTIQPQDANGNPIDNFKSESISTLKEAPPAVTGLFSQKSAESMTLSWKRPVTACEITAYTITYSGVAKWGHRRVHTGSAAIGHDDANGATSIVINGMQPYTDYSVMVTASTDKGVGEPTLFNTTTKEDAPEKPTHLEMYRSTPSAVLMTWQEPNELKGELKSYEVYCFAGETLVSTETTKHPVQLIEGLSACTKYTVEVAASTAGGRGDPAMRAVKTKAELPPPVTDLVAKDFPPQGFYLTWKRPATACEITSYNIIYTGVAMRGLGTEEHKGNKTIGRRDAEDTTSIYIDGLQPYTKYIVTVTVSTVEGVGAATRTDYFAAGAGDVPTTAASRKPNDALQRELWSNAGPALVASPSATLIASLMVSVHVAWCCSLLHGRHA